ncbi:MAG TPA: HAMP domain-containing sensor histidine kinase, partial [Reyranellaceae bacterium]|nr:HAMP domain-containing sensor histidine kinase [Reyranellaceae bacterium]
RTRALAPTIMGTIDRAARLAGDALDYVRGRPTPKFASLELADLVDEVGIALQEQGEERDPNKLRNWINRIEGECRIKGDRDLLYRVLVNLGRNAFDAGASTVTVSAKPNGRWLTVDVADNGPGLPQPVVAQLFQPFITGGRSGGAGLGLAIARDLVRAHDGNIALVDNGPSGATFRFTLPL